MRRSEERTRGHEGRRGQRGARLWGEYAGIEAGLSKSKCEVRNETKCHGGIQSVSV